MKNNNEHLDEEDEGVEEIKQWLSLKFGEISEYMTILSDFTFMQDKMMMT